MKLKAYFKKALRQQVFWISLYHGLPAAILAALLRLLDKEFEMDFLESVMPDKSVYIGFTSTVSIFLAFRTVQALQQYHTGARNLYQMVGSWYDSASTLISFCRASEQQPEQVLNFKHTVIRLFSLLNQICLIEMANSDDVVQHELLKKKQISFNTLDVGGLDSETLTNIKNVKCKAEFICTQIQCLIVDSMNNGIIQVPAPILSRSFQDIGQGMLKFHEILNIAQVPPPFPLTALTDCLLTVHSIYAAFMLAVWTKGPVSAACYTLVQVAVLHSLNLLAREIQNPFNGDMNDIDTEKLHKDLNERLTELLRCADIKVANTRASRLEVHLRQSDPREQPSRDSLFRSREELVTRESLAQYGDDDTSHIVDLLLQQVMATQSVLRHVSESRDSLRSRKSSHDSRTMDGVPSQTLEGDKQFLPDPVCLAPVLNSTNLSIVETSYKTPCEHRLPSMGTPTTPRLPGTPRERTCHQSSLADSSRQAASPFV